jgi:hypothetical protein
MTLDASGNLGVGATSLTYRLEVHGTNPAFRLKTAAATTGFIVDQSNTNSLVSLINYENAAIRFGTNATERASITSGGVLDIGTGAGAVGQIQFPATQVASSNANTLDDYEEGTWTPAFGTSGTAFTSVTYTGQNGTYTKVGQLVTVSMRIEISARTVGSASGDLLITGLPFTSNNTFGYWTGAVLTNSTATNNPSVVRVLGNSTSVDLFYYASLTGTTNVPATSLSSTAEIRLTVSYIV